MSPHSMELCKQRQSLSSLSGLPVFRCRAPHPALVAHSRVDTLRSRADPLNGGHCTDRTD
jgi:hypothetical protein